MRRRDISPLSRWAAVAVAGLGCLVFVGEAKAQSRGRSRGRSAQQMRQMQQQMQYQQQEMMRVNAEQQAILKELMAKFDEDGNGKLFGKEKAKFEAHLRRVNAGREPNPFAGIKPAGQGPRTGR